MTVLMDPASELMLWGDATSTVSIAPNARDLAQHFRPLMAKAFGVDWDEVDRLRAAHRSVDIAPLVSKVPEYEVYMTSREVREHMDAFGPDPVAVYDLEEYEVEYDSFCGPMRGRHWRRRGADPSPPTQAQRLLLDSFGPLPPIEPVPVDHDPDAPRLEPRVFDYPVVWNLSN